MFTIIIYKYLNIIENDVSFLSIFLLFLLTILYVILFVGLGNDKKVYGLK